MTLTPSNPAVLRRGLGDTIVVKLIALKDMSILRATPVGIRTGAIAVFVLGRGLIMRNVVLATGEEYEPSSDSGTMGCAGTVGGKVVPLTM